MRCFALFLLLMVCCVVAQSTSAQENKTLTVRSIAEAPSFTKRALVIGVGQYEHAGSLSPVTTNDARRFADLLKTQFKFPEEAITLLTDAPDTPNSQYPTYIHLRNAFKTLLAGINDKSEVVVYFSGHGTRAEDHDWLVPMDGLPSDVNATCINYDEFKSQLNTRTPARALLIVDACRNLSGGKDAGSSGFGAGKGLAGPQFAELLSCRPKEESKVGKPADFAESVFTHYLLQGLRGDTDAQDNGIVTFDSLNEYVQGRVSQYVSSKFGEAQNPEGRASQGRMVLAKVAVPMPSPLPRKPSLPDRAELVYILAGEFTMGSTEADVTALLAADARLKREYFTKEIGQHRVYLDGYYICKTPVTVKQYKQYCAATGKAMPDAPSFNADWSKEDHPIVNVSWNDATAYCQWLSQQSGLKVSLPTEAQWEKAVRGEDGRKFPWGNTFDGSRLQHSTKKLGDAGGTAAVGSFLNGASPYGVLDMAGNVWQWCADYYDENYYQSSPRNNPAGPASGIFRVLRGGSWHNGNETNFRCANRDKDSPDVRANDGGFRCVVSADSQ